MAGNAGKFIHQTFSRRKHWAKTTYNVTLLPETFFLKKQRGLLTTCYHFCNFEPQMSSYDFFITNPHPLYWISKSSYFSLTPYYKSFLPSYVPLYTIACVPIPFWNYSDYFQNSSVTVDIVIIVMLRFDRLLMFCRFGGFKFVWSQFRVITRIWLFKLSFSFVIWDNSFISVLLNISFLRTYNSIFSVWFTSSFTLQKNGIDEWISLQ